ncbi:MULTISPECIES: hypothetical protein [Rhizobium]|uniref:Uncharacterized protein n=1 Tax=Rhizobium straminoryzae TaxID=1387186 RepID=A0A549TEC3_9HYPH|nr:MULTISPECIES: hypothetical protein [Rhizobium]TRL40514.1 hypothetical protein FNA46_06375 [Rhizobium straminoryzae]
MRVLVITILQALALILLPSAAGAQQKLLSDPEIYEKDYFRAQCKSVEFGPDFISRIDINNDGIIDAVVNHGAVTCDGQTQTRCDAEGCPYNFYLQAKEGGYFMIATAQLFGYEFIKRFGNMVFVFNMAPHYCDRTDSAPCEMTVRVRGARMVTISKK